MSLCQNVKPKCRVDLPRISTSDQPGGECAIVPGKIGDMNTKIFTTPHNVIYTRPGVVIRNWNHRGLRLAQKQDYLTPEFFNSGCSTFYGNCHLNEGPNSSQNLSPMTQSMYDSMFSSYDQSQGNNASSNCGGCCGRSQSYNDQNGWMVNNHGKLNH